MWKLFNVKVRECKIYLFAWRYISQNTAGNFLKFGFVFEIQIARVIEFVRRICIDIYNLVDVNYKNI